MNCPAFEFLEQFAIGTATDSAMASHVESCSACQSKVESIRENQAVLRMLRTTEPTQDPTARPVADSIPGYKILTIVHRGGQGIVYKAMQETTRRKVALKVLIEGAFATPRERHRFEREIDLVASLNHPNIVHIYDSGVAPDGRPYFAMEYVHGVSLDEFARSKIWDSQAPASSSVLGPLRLFNQICEAVSYAHQRGVIHRDLKPANIRVDTQGHPHVVDFGIAKAAGIGVSDGVPVTVTGEFMGTLTYASPEQVRGDSNSVDVRSDVYSLGVILYEMLTGRYPYPVVGSMAEVAKNITDVEPKRPSVFRKELNDEIDTITLKALAKQPERRYQSAGELARDIERYLNGEPIEAKRDSIYYLLGKTLRRYRIPVALGAVMLASGIVLGVIATFAYVRLQKQSTDIVELYEKVVDASSDAIMTFDSETGVFLQANDATLELYGYTWDEFERKTVFDISAEPQKTGGAVRRIAIGEPERIPDRHFRRKDGTTFFGDITTGKFIWDGRTMILGAVRFLREGPTMSEIEALGPEQKTQPPEDFEDLTR